MVEQTVKCGKQRFAHRYRWLHDVPLRDGRDALTVNWFEIEIINPRGETTYTNSFVIERVFAWEDKFRRLLLRFERTSGLHYAFKTLAYTMINLRHYCQI